MRKVLLVITKANWGGAQKYVFELATRLPKDQFEVKVICGQGEIMSQKLKDAGIIVMQIPELGRDVDVGSDTNAFSKLRQIFKLENPDIVHLNSSKIGGLGALAAKFAGVKKIIFTVHGFAFNEDRSGMQKIAIKLLSWLTLFLSTDVICISEQEYNQVKNWPFVSKKIKVIHNGITEQAFLDKAAAQQELAKALNKSSYFFSDKKIVGTIAELTKNKGLEYAVYAFKNIENAVYVIIGAGEQKEYLTKLIKDTNLENRVFLAGYISDASKLLKAFDVFLLPSLKEGVPYVILEAGNAWVPVIATNVGGVSEIIDSNSGMLIQPKSTEEIVKAVKEILSSQAGVGTRENNLNTKIKNSFSFEKMLEQTSAVYQEKR